MRALDAAGARPGKWYACDEGGPLVREFVRAFCLDWIAHVEYRCVYSRSQRMKYL